MSIITRTANSIRSVLDKVGNPLKPNQNYRGTYGYGYGAAPYDLESRNSYMTMASVFGCITAYALNDPQVKLRVEHLDGEPWPEHPLQWLIQNPNDDMSEKTVRLFNCIYKPLGGATQLYLYRSNRTNQVVGWRPFPVNEIAAVPVVGRTIGRDSWVDHYWHTPMVGTPERIERENIITLRFPSINPITPQLNLSPIAAAFKDIEADLQITQLPIDLMKNGAFISWVFSLGENAEGMDDDAYEMVKTDIASGFTQGNRFSPMVVRGGGSAKFEGIDFSKMEFSKLGARPELRICVALRVPIRYMGFAAGIDASTSDNYTVSWISFVKDAIIGQAILDADVMTNSLRRENWQNHPVAILYGLDRKANSEFRIVPDTSDVEALKTELLAKNDNSRKNHIAGATTLDELRADLGKPAVGPERGGDDFRKATAFGSNPNANSQDDSQDDPITKPKK